MPTPAPHPSRSATTRRSRRVSLAVATLAVAGLGGAVAAAYVTSVELGAGLAPVDEPSSRPADEADAAAPGAAPAGPTTTGTTTTPPVGADGTSLPDRARPGGAGEAPSTTGSTAPGAPGTEVPAPAGSFPGVWPYGSWAEVEAHRSRGDGRFLTPTDTALRLAREVAGAVSPTVTDIALDGARATVRVRNQGSTTTVRMVRAVEDGPLLGAPWSVTGATGGVDLTAAEHVDGPTLPARTSAPATVAVFDRTRWRGVGQSTVAGALDVRVEPGTAGPALVVALDGDPRDPRTFTLRPVDLGAGAGAPAPAPTGVQTATDALLASLRTGDVGAAWAVLAALARDEALDWRGLAARMPLLLERWSPLDGDDRRTATVPTAVGEVAVVLPADRSAAGLALTLDGGTARVASLEPATTEVLVESDAVVVRGRSRPVALLLDGTAVTAEPEGTVGSRLPLASVSPGPHVVTAVVVEDGRVRVARHAVEVTAAEPEPPVASSRAGAADATADAAPRG